MAKERERGGLVVTKTRMADTIRALFSIHEAPLSNDDRLKLAFVLIPYKKEELILNWSKSQNSWKSETEIEEKEKFWLVASRRALR